MQFIKDFFDFLINTITTIWSFFTGLVEDLILFVNYVTSAVGLAAECILTFPSWLKIFGTITIGVCVIYLLLGRSAGKSS